MSVQDPMDYTPDYSIPDLDDATDEEVSALEAALFEAPAPALVVIAPARYGEIAYDIATGGAESEANIAALLDKHGITQEQLEQAMTKPAFRQTLAEAKRYVSQHGQDRGFMVRARFYAEHLLGDMYDMASSKANDPAVRLKTFEAISRLANLEPVKDKEASAPQMQVVLNIGSGIRGVSDNTITVDTKEVNE